MSADTAIQEIPALVFVFEASLLVAQEWRSRRLFEYCTSILKRLTDAYATRLRLAVVSYGSSDTLPSPILCKRFFIEYPIVFREMAEDISRTGVGTAHTGSRGMAALEGLVAALELFDILQSQTSIQGPARTFVSHIIHIASAAPDESQHPSWNDSPAFDDVSWESLPGELKKRNIHFTTINLRPALPRYQELYAALITGGPTPWFNVKPPHTIFLASFVAPAQPKAAPVKRANDPQTNAECAPDSKRMRIQPIVESPKPAQKPITTITSQPVVPAPAPAQIQPPRPPQEITPQQVQNPPPPPPNSAALSRIQQQQILDRLRHATENIAKLERELKAAQAGGNTQLAEEIAAEHRSKKDQFTQAIATYRQQHIHAAKQAQAQGLGPGQGQGQGPSQPQSQPNHPQIPGHPPKEPSTLPFSLNNSTNSLSTGNLPSVPPNLSMVAGATRSISETTVSTTNMSPALAQAQFMNHPTNPNMQSQMQKLIDQQQRLRPPLTGGGANPMLGGMSNPMVNPNVARPNGLNNAVAGPSQPPQQLQPQPQQVVQQGGKPIVPKQTYPVWNGSLNWSGHGTGGKKEMKTYVVASTANVVECHVETWPQALQLVPTREAEVSMSDLQVWMKRYQPALCTFNVQPLTANPQANESDYNSLVHLLTIKKLFATAAWTTPSGGQTSNVLLFPVNFGLAGAFFPLTGLPELPKRLTAPYPAQQPPKPMPMPGSSNNLGLPFDLPPVLAAKLNQLSPEQRPQVIAQLVARHKAQSDAQRLQQQQLLQNQQHSQRPQAQMPHMLDMSGSGPFNLNMPQGVGNNNMNVAMMNMMNTQNPNGMMMGMNAPQASMPTALPRMGMNNAGGGGGMPNNLSIDMIQSFMARNPENGNHMNPQG